MPKYYPYPFAVDGITATVPDPTQSNASVSYQSGYTINYTYNPLTNPNGFDFPLDQNNQILYDMTANIQQYWQFGVPQFITSMMNLGTPYAYAQYARCTLGGRVYESLINSNTDTPPSSNWLDISLPVIKTWAGSTTPVNVQGDGVNITLSGTNNQVITFQAGSGANSYVTAAQLRANFWTAVNDTGTVNNIVLNPSPVYTFPNPNPSIIWFGTPNTNTGPTTVTINGNGPVNVQIQPEVHLRGGEILAGGFYGLVGSSFTPGNAFILINGAPDAAQQGGYYTTGQDTGAVNAYVVNPYAGNTVSLLQGANCTVYIANTNTSTTCTLNWGGTGVLPIVAPQDIGRVPRIGALISGFPYTFIIDPTLSFWVLVNPSA